ncbi:MAG: flavodoxin family protein [Thermodesulfobacteriota bacterium]|jgi:multimeric flavodoxin WrbA
MKVVAFNGSPRKDGNTTILINHVFNELDKEGIETELVQLSGKKIHGCIACYKCFQNKDQQCSVKEDDLNECIEKMIGADGIILGSPVYFADLTSEMKALIDRAGFVSLANGGLYRNKVGASVVALRRTGGIQTLDSLNHFFLAGQIIIVGRGIGIGRDKGDVEKDEEGLQMVKTLGQRMAWLLKKLYG